MFALGSSQQYGPALRAHAAVVQSPLAGGLPAPVVCLIPRRRLLQPGESRPCRRSLKPFPAPEAVADMIMPAGSIPAASPGMGALPSDRRPIALCARDCSTGLSRCSRLLTHPPATAGAGMSPRPAPTAALSGCATRTSCSGDARPRQASAPAPRGSRPSSAGHCRRKSGAARRPRRPPAPPSAAT